MNVCAPLENADPHLPRRIRRVRACSPCAWSDVGRHFVVANHSWWNGVLCTRVHVGLSRPRKTLIAPDRFPYNAILPLHAESVLMTRRGVMAHSWGLALLLAGALPSIAHPQEAGTTTRPRPAATAP